MLFSYPEIMPNMLSFLSADNVALSVRNDILSLLEQLVAANKNGLAVAAVIISKNLATILSSLQALIFDAKLQYGSGLFLPYNQD